MLDLKIVRPVKFDKENKSIAEKLIKAITNALWAIDNNHQQINKAYADKQCKQLPAYFFNIYNKQYFDYKSRKRAKTRLSEETLRTSSNGIYDVLDMWNHTRFPNELLIKACRGLAECLRSYSDYLVKCQKRMTQNRSNDTDRLSHNFQLSNIILPVSKLNVKKRFRWWIDFLAMCRIMYQYILTTTRLILGFQRIEKCGIYGLKNCR